jgi:hypothetical protein
VLYQGCLPAFGCETCTVVSQFINRSIQRVYLMHCLFMNKHLIEFELVPFEGTVVCGWRGFEVV